jgi:alkanesulfonate monooxygenase SsuD/methylene tetrahydromethanopterin reductase-like flavin-dependent oxidoreductase (luciferase family)
VARFILRFDLRTPALGPPHADLYSAALDMCEWADRLNGHTAQVMLHEHHGAEDGYLPSPIVFAAAVAGRTRNVAIDISAIILPLYDPLRLAEDLAVLDLISRGRTTWVFVVGYRREEYASFGVDFSRRGELMESGVDTLKKAWTGRPFQFNGVDTLVRPTPYTLPRPPIVLGGFSDPAARRAARIADGFSPNRAGAMAAYRDERARLGGDPGPAVPDMDAITPTVVGVADDPDKLWATIGPCCMHEMNTYAEWFEVGSGGVGQYWKVADIDELREAGTYLVLTPDGLLDLWRTREVVMFHPLCGGIAPDLAWRSLRLIEDKVLPELQ